MIVSTLRSAKLATDILTKKESRAMASNMIPIQVIAGLLSVIVYG